MSSLRVKSIREYFDEIGYSETDRTFEDLSYIVGLTKTRPQRVLYTGPTAGDEHILLVQGVCKAFGVKKMFEIGTGRGTSCYASALVESVEQIDTIDIRWHHNDFPAAIWNKSVTVSNESLYNHCKFEEKKKINFYHTSQLLEVYQKLIASGQKYDLAHIDGNHSDYEVVMQDFLNCYNLVRPGGKILFDDYEARRFIVKKVVTDIIETMPNLNPTLVVHRGHIFKKEADGSPSSSTSLTEERGLVVLTKPEN